MKKRQDKISNILKKVQYNNFMHLIMVVVSSSTNTLFKAYLCSTHKLRLKRGSV